jgi:hypothetical protein
VPPRSETSSPQRRRTARAVTLAAFLAAVIAYYLFVVSAGHWTVWRTWSAYYDAQAEGFRSGHLYAAVPVSPALAALPDPLNPAHMRLWRWDYSFYGGHFHLYWGLAPAALLALVKTILRIHRPIADDVLVFIFMIGRALAGSLLIRAAARRLTPAPPGWAVWLAMAVFTTAHPTPYLLARGAIYEAAIAAGACFMVTAFYLAFQAVFAAQGRADAPAGARAAAGWSMGASLSVGLAGAARVSLLPAGAVLVGLLILARWRAAGRAAAGKSGTGTGAAGAAGGWRRQLGADAYVAACVAAPFGVVTLLQFLLNYLRYGAWNEFGQRYQMGFQWFAMGPRFLAANLYLYLFRPIVRACTFPFLLAKWGRPADLFPRWLPVPADYRISEPSAGVFVLIPFAWLLLGLGLARWLGRPIVTLPAAAAATDTAATAAVDRRRWRWMVYGLALVTAACAAPAFLPGAATMRYEADFASGLLLLAILGGFYFLCLPGRAVVRAGIRIVYVLLAVATIAAGVLLGFTGYFEHFSKHNPALLRSLVHALSVCH